MSAFAIITFRNSVPGAQSLAETVAHNPTLQALNKTVWAFSLVEISHLLFLAMLGGATLVLALRSLGVALVDVPLVQVEGLTRPWLRVGVIGGLLSGVFMSIATALTLVANGAFFIKILALVAAILFSFALSARVRGQRGAATGGLGALLLLWALWLFASTRGVTTGAMLIGVVVSIFAAAVLALRGRERADGLAQVLAAGTVLGWLTVTLAGRWIGFS